MRSFISIGSNIGDGIENCLMAIDMINKTKGCSVIKRSSFYRTEPVGFKNQDWFINCVIMIDTIFSPFKLLQRLQEIENIMGRERKIKWGPRIIDLDILLFDSLIIRDKTLTIPHPLMHKRRFVLVPMNQLAPDLIHPIFNKTIRELLTNIPDDGQTVVLIKD